MGLQKIIETDAMARHKTETYLDLHHLPGDAPQKSTAVVELQPC